MRLRRYFDAWYTVVKNNFVREFIYRSNTIAMTLADMVWVAVELAFFEIIYSNITVINGWTKEQTYFFLGIFISSDALFTTFFQRAFWAFPNLINQGELDTLLTKPINAVFLATFKDLNFTQLVNLILGFWIIHHYGPAAGFEGGIYWLGVAFWIFVGLITQYLLRFFFCVWSFWLERGITISVLYYQFYALANKPLGLYPKIIQYLLKTILPFAFMGAIPAVALLGRLSMNDYLSVAAVLGGYGCLCWFLWVRGLRRYQSASS
ncbi:MAG: ABC-2 family transporter protein [Bdellovibrionales bacterium]|nr:ABC-2 family transporter protein [Bdellovibrionales bacterium]